MKAECEGPRGTVFAIGGQLGVVQPVLGLYHNHIGRLPDSVSESPGVSRHFLITQGTYPGLYEPTPKQ